ncbi:MAG: chemotaxis-specific protein-glutamate methyltransferase CheB [Myxococcota bacterium]
MTRRIRVLVVDDSAFARKVVRECLALDPQIEVVGTARDGLDALEKIAELSPDVITLDLVMPNLDGITLLGHLPASPPRVVICSTAEVDSAMVVHALSLGAIASVHKPTALATERLYEIGRPLIEAVKLAASAGHVGPAALELTPLTIAPRAVRTQFLAIGASTGGPQAISQILKALPADFPVPVAVVVHMPSGYTEGFASRLNDNCALEVIEAHDGAALAPGRVIIARGGLHLCVHPSGGSVRLSVQPLDRPHRPSVDILFTTAAAAFRDRTLAVVLTGMGDDGLVGSRAVVSAGGRVLTQSAATCVVYGMPRVVAEAGLSAGIAGLDEMARTIGSAL